MMGAHWYCFDNRAGVLAGRQANCITRLSKPCVTCFVGLPGSHLLRRSSTPVLRVLLLPQVAAGAQVILTQPPLDWARFEAWMEDARRRQLHSAARLLVGFPLLSSAANVTFWGALCGAGGNQQVSVAGLHCSCSSGARLRWASALVHTCCFCEPSAVSPALHVALWLFLPGHFVHGILVAANRFRSCSSSLLPLKKQTSSSNSSRQASAASRAPARLHSNGTAHCCSGCRRLLACLGCT